MGRACAKAAAACPPRATLLTRVPRVTRAGMSCVALVNPHTDRDLYVRAGADVILTSVEEFHPEAFGLPAYA